VKQCFTAAVLYLLNQMAGSFSRVFTNIINLWLVLL